MKKKEIFSETAENIVISYLINNPIKFEEYGFNINGNDFYFKKNKQIFEEMKKQFIDFEKFTYTSIEKSFANKETIKERKSFTPNKYDFEVSFKLVREYSGLRKVVDLGNEIINSVYEETNLDQSVDLFNQACNEINKDVVESDFRDLSEVIDETKEWVDRYIESGGNAVMGLSTGYDNLDNSFGGLQGGKLYIIGARPSQGKTAFSLNLVLDPLLKGKSVAFFSLEMGAKELTQRYITMISEIPKTMLKKEYMNDTRKKELMGAYNQLSKTNLFIEDNSSTTINSLKVKCKKLHKEKGLDCIVIDYLQLLTSGGSYGVDRLGEITYISRELKKLAKELDCPVVALSQLNRGLESRDDKTPKMSDIRESGAIEQDADVIMFIHRPAYFKQVEEFVGETQIIIGKNREGETGTKYFQFAKDIQRFHEYERVES